MPIEEDVPGGTGAGWATVSWARSQLAASGVGSGVPDGYAIDPELAQGTINELTRITNEVRGFLTQTGRLRFQPPGYDAVSVNLARNGDTMAIRAEAFVKAWADQIEATRNALQAQLDNYSQVEDVNRELLT